MNENYLLINNQSNIVENICVWDGNLQTWTPPNNYLLLVQKTTPAKIWIYSNSIQDYELQTVIGEGQIGFVWNGVECVTNEPKPQPPIQPATSGTQEV